MENLVSFLLHYPTYIKLFPYVKCNSTITDAFINWKDFTVFNVPQFFALGNTFF